MASITKKTFLYIVKDKSCIYIEVDKNDDKEDVILKENEILFARLENNEITLVDDNLVYIGYKQELYNEDNKLIQIKYYRNSNLSFNKTRLLITDNQGIIFEVDEEMACVSNTIKVLITDMSSLESKDKSITFKEIDTKNMTLVCNFWLYKLKYPEGTKDPPKFPLETFDVLDLITVAHFLDT